ncbi:small ribosomal subunit protein mS29 isoform X1 [Pelobates fuscus]|uniref:small ribosomal subunit protein mS29 isoform X1 n=1 Tax=Pelobates fuscus TaxID=191477 RepID=UPI002FE4677E
MQTDDAKTLGPTGVCPARREDMLFKQLHRWTTQQLIPAHRALGKAWITSVSQQADTLSREIFRTKETDPDLHTEQHEGQYYPISAQDVKLVFPQSLPNRYQLQCKTFNESCLMVRKPALELINYLRNANYSHPALRYVLYGKKGSGKSLTLCHVLHYCHKQGWLILNVPDAHILVKNCKELMTSSYNKDRFDQPLEASNWLKNFKASNEPFLKQIQTQQRYVWSKREATEEGRPLGEVVDQGLTRVKSASDAVGVVLKELKRQSGGGAFRLLVSVDGVNALWGRTTIKKENKSMVSPEELTLIHNLRKMLKNDWNGGAIITSVTQTGSLFQPKRVYLPHELLGKDGFEALDPFVPIQVPNYSEKEFESCYQYYIERNWIQHEKVRTEEGKKELLFMSNSSPRELEKICAFL